MAFAEKYGFLADVTLVCCRFGPRASRFVRDASRCRAWDWTGRDWGRGGFFFGWILDLRGVVLFPKTGGRGGWLGGRGLSAETCVKWVMLAGCLLGVESSSLHYKHASHCSLSLIQEFPPRVDGTTM